MYPPIVLGHAGRCIQRQRHTFKLNYRDLSHTYLVQCTYAVVYVVVSDTSAMSHETIVMYPPIVIYSNCIHASMGLRNLVRRNASPQAQE